MDNDYDPAGAVGERAYPAVPRQDRVFDERLMTPARLVELAQRRGVKLQRDERGIVICCAECEGQVTALDPAPYRGRKLISQMSLAEIATAHGELEAWGPSYALDLGQLLADTVRHGVMHHDDVLSGAAA